MTETACHRMENQSRLFLSHFCTVRRRVCLACETTVEWRAEQLIVAS
jgi:hypothetical protein